MTGRWQPIAEWFGGGVLAGCVLGAGGAWYFTSATPVVRTVTVQGPTRVVTRRIVVYRHNVVAQSVVRCGNRKIRVAALLEKNRAPVRSKKYFHSNKIILRFKSHRNLFSVKQHVSLTAGYAVMGSQFSASSGVSLGVEDRFARFGPVGAVAQVMSVGRGVVGMVGLRVRL